MELQAEQVFFPGLSASALRHPAEARRLAGNAARVAALLRKEEDRERERDRRYWLPLRRELERWRREGR